VPSAYELAEEAKKKCGQRYSPQEYALFRSKSASDQVRAELWLKAAEILKDWEKPG
jgi:hypothetical protein